MVSGEDLECFVYLKAGKMYFSLCLFPSSLQLIFKFTSFAMMDQKGQGIMQLVNSPPKKPSNSQPMSMASIPNSQIHTFVHDLASKMMLPPPTPEITPWGLIQEKMDALCLSSVVVNFLEGWLSLQALTAQLKRLWSPFHITTINMVEEMYYQV